MIIDYFYQLQHRRLRERFGLAAVERREELIMWLLDKRRAARLQQKSVDAVIEDMKACQPMEKHEQL